MKYTTKIDLNLTQNSAKSILEFYKLKADSLNYSLEIDNKMLKLWQKSNDQQLINYYNSSIASTTQKQEIFKQKANYLFNEIKNNNHDIPFRMLGQEFHDFKTSYLHDLHVKYNNKYDYRSKNKNIQLSIIDDFTNREFFNKKLPDNEFIPFCATDIYWLDVPQNLIEKLSPLADKDTLELCLSPEITKAASKAIELDQKTIEQKQKPEKTK